MSSSGSQVTCGKWTSVLSACIGRMGDGAMMPAYSPKKRPTEVVAGGLTGCLYQLPLLLVLPPAVWIWGGDRKRSRG